MNGASIWNVVAVGILATYVWRAAGILVASRIAPESGLARWFTAVAYAVLAGLIVRMLVLPEGVLGAVPLPDKLAGLAAGVAAYFVAGRSVPVGTASAFIGFAAIAVWRFVSVS